MLERFECDPENAYSIRPTPECRAFFELHIPEGVRVLPENAFGGYTVHNKLTFPDSLQVLGEGKGGAFSHCELGEVTLPKRAEIGPNAFSGSRIDTVKIPDGADHQTTVKLAHALRFTYSFWIELGKNWPQEYADIYYGKSEPPESWKRLINGSGTFSIDSDGVLMDFDCASDNETESGMFRLNIPEGATAIPSEMFHNCRVLWDLTLPEFLRSIGCGSGFGNTFAGSLLPDVVLPKKLELIGMFAFGASRIGCLAIPGSLEDSLLWTGARQFKDSHVQQIRMPAKYRAVLEGHCKAWNRFTGGELTDPELGRLCYVKAEQDMMLRGGEIIPSYWRR